jgi:hypothetical protein
MTRLIEAVAVDREHAVGADRDSRVVGERHAGARVGAGDDRIARPDRGVDRTCDALSAAFDVHRTGRDFYASDIGGRSGRRDCREEKSECGTSAEGVYGIGADDGRPNVNRACGRPLYYRTRQRELHG